MDGCWVEELGPDGQLHLVCGQIEQDASGPNDTIGGPEGGLDVPLKVRSPAGQIPVSYRDNRIGSRYFELMFSKEGRILRAPEITSRNLNEPMAIIHSLPTYPRNRGKPN